MDSQSLTRRNAFRFPLAIALSLTLLIALSGTVAAETPTIIRDATTFAGAFSSNCVIENDGTEVCTYVSLQVVSTDESWEVCVDLSTATYPPIGDPSFTDASGCTVVDSGAFDIDSTLATATLQPITVTLVSTTCDELGNCTETSQDVTVSASWTGTGELVRFSDRSSFQEGKCKQTFTGKGTSRESQATITINGDTLQADDAVLVTSRSMIKISSSCP
jgi:hypothetical protein